MTMWVDGNIYGWQPEVDLYLYPLSGAIMVIPVLYIIAESMLESPLVLQRLRKSSIERAALRKE